MTPHERADAVQTREELAVFVRLLMREMQEKPTDWENTRLADFLEAMAAWVDDMDGWYQNRGTPPPEQPSWSVFANILVAAAHYE